MTITPLSPSPFHRFRPTPPFHRQRPPFADSDRQRRLRPAKPGASSTRSLRRSRPRWPKPAPRRSLNRRPIRNRQIRSSSAGKFPIDRHQRRRELPAVSSLEAFRTPASVQPLRPVTGRHPKTLNDSRPSSLASERRGSVESECGAVALGRPYLLPPLSSGGASLVRPWLPFPHPLIGRVEDWRAGLGRCRATFPAPSTSSGRWRFRRRRGSASTRFFRATRRRIRRPAHNTGGQPHRRGRQASWHIALDVVRQTATAATSQGSPRRAPANSTRPNMAETLFWRRGRHVEVTPEPPPEASRFTRQDAVLQRPASSGTASSYSSYTPTPDGVTRINERTKKSATGKFRTRLGRSAAHFVATDRE